VFAAVGEQRHEAIGQQARDGPRKLQPLGAVRNRTIRNLASGRQWRRNDARDDEHGTFTEVSVHATVGTNGYPDTVRYQFCDQFWTWRIDPQGQRPPIAAVSMPCADGTCVRDGEHRRVPYSMGNSDWWTDGRADNILMPQTGVATTTSPAL